MTNVRALLVGTLVCLPLAACGDDKDDATTDTHADTTTPSDTTSDTTAPDTSGTLCAKYGGTAAVAAVMSDHVVPALAGDCRIGTFFTSLPEAQLTHVVECLTLQVEGLFGCEGVDYATAKDSQGDACRSMADAHAGLKISTGDFDALIEDVVAGLTAGGVSEADIGAAAPALLGMKGDIVEQDVVQDPTKSTCADRSLCQKYGGAGVIDSVITGPVVSKLAGDCRINTFFTSLSETALNHVAECLSIQGQEVFGCKGVTYAGSMDSKGAACRSMAAAHLGLSISDGDFQALLDDVVAALTEAGVASGDIAAAAPAFLGLKDDIVEQDGVTTPTQADCPPQ